MNIYSNTRVADADLNALADVADSGIRVEVAGLCMRVAVAVLDTLVGGVELLKCRILEGVAHTIDSH